MRVIVRFLMVFLLSLFFSDSYLLLQEQMYTTGTAYVIIVSHRTFKDEKWHDVVRKLQQKHSAFVIKYNQNVYETLPVLQKIQPAYVCLVAKWQEVKGKRENHLNAVGSQMVRDMHHLTRAVDEDEYGDCIWGIITGADADDAMKLVNAPAKLPIKYAFLKTAGGNLKHFKSGIFISEGKDCKIVKKQNGKTEEKKGPEDTTKIWTKLINSNKVDFILTSGHATDKDWQAGYPPRRDGFMFCKNTQLYSMDLTRKIYKIKSTNPKIYLGAGNCLIGLVSGKNCMALSWIRAGGAVQFCGYTVVTAFGYMGWGINHYFINLEGRFSFAESFFINNQALLFDLKNKVKKVVGADRYGLLYDKDPVVLYGDPKLDARLVPGGNVPYKQSLKRKKITQDLYKFTFRVTTTTDTSLGRRPVFSFLPFKVKDVKIISSDARFVEVTDNFIIARFQKPGEKKLDKGKTMKVVFRARKSMPTPFSADDLPESGLKELAKILDTLPENLKTKLKKIIKKYPKAYLYISFLGRYKGQKRRALGFLISQLPYRNTQILGRLGGRLLKRWYKDIEIAPHTLLLEAVDLGFKAREKFSWASELDMDKFLRFVIVYRGTTEWLENWRKMFWSKKTLHKKVVEFNQRYKNAGTEKEKAKIFRELIFYLNSTYLASKVKYVPRGRPDLSPSELLDRKKGRCTDLTNTICAILRTYGIASTNVRVVAWTNRAGNHCWATVYSPPEDRWLDIESGSGAKFGKQYFTRYRFPKNPKNKFAKLYMIVPGEEHGKIYSFAREVKVLPELYGLYVKNLPLIDVTAKYTKTTIAKIAGLPANTVVFLAVKNDGAWLEVAATKTDKNGIATFKDIDCNTTYRIYVSVSSKRYKRQKLKEFKVDKNGKIVKESM